MEKRQSNKALELFWTHCIVHHRRTPEVITNGVPGIVCLHCNCIWRQYKLVPRLLHGCPPFFSKNECLSDHTWNQMRKVPAYICKAKTGHSKAKMEDVRCTQKVLSRQDKPEKCLGLFFWLLMVVVCRCILLFWFAMKRKETTIEMEPMETNSSRSVLIAFVLHSWM